MYKFLIVDRKQKEDGKKRERERKNQLQFQPLKKIDSFVQRVNKTEGAAKERTKRRKKEEGKKRSKRDYDEEWR